MKNLSVLLLIVFFSSCASNNNVVRSGFFQKRKYKKGYHLSFKKSLKNEAKDHNEVVLANQAEKKQRLEEGGGLAYAVDTSVVEKDNGKAVDKNIFSASLESSDYAVMSTLERAVLLSDTISNPVLTLDEDEKVYVKKWDIGALLGGGVGGIFSALILVLLGALDSVLILVNIGVIVFILALVAIIYGLVLIDRRFVAPKREVAKAKELEEKKIRDKEREAQKIKEEQDLKSKLENDDISEKEKKRIEIRSKKWYLARVLSYVFTALTLVIPIFVFPAAVFTIMTMNIERKNEKNWVRISAVFRLVFLLFFTIIGIAVVANILNSLGVVTL